MSCFFVVTIETKVVLKCVYLLDLALCQFLQCSSYQKRMGWSYTKETWDSSTDIWERKQRNDKNYWPVGSPVLLPKTTRAKLLTDLKEKIVGVEIKQKGQKIVSMIKAY